MSFTAAIIGRPNVGKSTLVNNLLGRERLLTGPEAGITRDSIAIDWSWKGTPIRLIDTAGLRRRSKVVDKVERLSSADTDRAVSLWITEYRVRSHARSRDHPSSTE